MRRRTRSADNTRRHRFGCAQKNNASIDDLTKSKIKEHEETSSTKASDGSENSEKGSLRRNRSSILEFGREFCNKNELLDLSSDQDSTGGEDDEEVGKTNSLNYILSIILINNFV